MARPIKFKDAKAFVARHHRHHRPPQGHQFSIGAFDGDRLVGVVICGRPVARRNDDGATVEITRLCVLPEVPNACSFLIGRAKRAARALCYTRMISYTLEREPGGSWRAAGCREV